MRCKTHRCPKQCYGYLEYRIGCAKRPHRQKCASDRAYHGVYRVPDRVHPWDLVCKKFQEEQNAGKYQNNRISQN